MKKLWRVLEIIAGLVLIAAEISNGKFYSPTNVYYISYDITAIAFALLGVYWIYNGIKKLRAK